MQHDSYNRGGFYAFLFSIIFSLGFFVYLAVFYPGIDLKEVPEANKPAEQAVAGDGGSTTEAADVSQVSKPWESSEAMITHGKKVYQNNCLICHGAEGKGDGPAGKSLVPPPRNLVEGKWKKGGDSISLFTTVQKGLDGTSMAAFGHLPMNDRWAVIHFIRSISQNATKDDAAKVEAFAKTAK